MGALPLYVFTGRFQRYNFPLSTTAKIMTFGQFFSQNLFSFALLIVAATLLARLEWRRWQQRTPQLSPAALGPFVNGGGILIDLRPSNEFKAGHIAGAQNYPAEHFQAGQLKFPKDKPLLIYNSDAMNLDGIVQQLTAAGYRVSLLEGGLNAWLGENFPLNK